MSPMASEKADYVQPNTAPQQLYSEEYPASASELCAPPQRRPDDAEPLPSIDDPFNFPTEEPLPAYSEFASDDPLQTTTSGAFFANAAAASGPSHAAAAAAAAPITTHPLPLPRLPSLKPIAIAQTAPNASSPFLSAYPPCLLARGITASSWSAFLHTASAFLTAKVSDRAVSHAGEMARRLAQDTASLGKSLARHGRSLGADVTRHARRGNVLGIAATAVAGAVSLPIMAALGAIDTAARLPGTITAKPKTPAERVAAYIAVANEEWFHRRGLHAQLAARTSELARLLRLPAEEEQQLLAMARSGKQGGVANMLEALALYTEPLQVSSESTLSLSDSSLWLVVVEKDAEE